MSTQLSVRRSQLISPFGVGSICEIDGQSFIVKDTGLWNLAGLSRIRLDRITARLNGVRSLMAPREKVPVARFPRWLFCPTCRSMYRWSYKLDQGTQDSDTTPRPACGNRTCQGADLVPMRFVQVCDNGHIDDIDWYWWAHKKSQAAKTGSCSRDSARLKFQVRGERGGDFDSMRISCSCNATNTLEGIADGPVGTCSGRQPWRSPSECDKRAFMEPRGSTALHYASTLSALEISLDPEAGAGIREKLLDDPRFKGVIKTAHSLGLDLALEVNSAVVDMARAQLALIAADLDVDSEEVWAIFIDELEPADDEADPSIPMEYAVSDLQKDIFSDEFTVLSLPEDTLDGPLVRRVHKLGNDSPLGIHRFFSKIVQVESLREVRVFRGFQRRDVTSANVLIEADLGKQVGWLPAIDVRGEGVFLEINKPALSKWLQDNRKTLEDWVKPQLEAAEEGQLSDRFSTHLGIPFLMIHTLAHLLMNQLSFDCGYSSTSLRERLYCGPPESLYGGLLIYTADSDAEGSMGGLVEMGEPQRFAEVIYRAVSSSQWCSGDPVCRELPQQGMRGLNRAACHACCLVAETSCTHANTLLNRVLVSGDGRENGRGGLEPFGFLQPITSL
jgi:hypothetical protein